ncbi:MULTISPECIES: thiamine pyrophosphate-dependent dehydrogenase E1 component subunit alpha [unclassified Microbacterium]|uniref:thiamine pyrophosphate-dependent dehydrogenase E1 component subunit alpha n=1 Tax=unclassified Microbacterium TaxID=2609290 RepID=UPI000CFC9250|nr:MULTISPECIES: thiamine pyrophosphate-dependent dehydrogenase E1 component subunit alpha [unclassified Microbacterium]PQZ60136.1 pyruvate dehydrogenase (acetyl-transferring) E1 component subunit alpha [Microbacterium sp. MYb43]PQZ79518.1 pyruvate dehydrogenase (acetyl-transferring) E1 component subunit alpha [Microbacterium sp. MYb40]PRB23179.1 pyruvate dehydrogenase (acetyl-transferring) E1 component subunit alpha [Microbacterium sp. MYb54]PRB27544.1 pyruvate dehydrogenase (acetyl-transferri
MTTSETPLVSVLDETGRYAPSAAAERYLPLIEAIGDAELEQFYRDMVVIRAIDTQATNLQRQGQLALWPPSRGQEAAQVGSGRAARAQDTIFPSYREHAVTRIRGVDPVDIIKLMRGVSHGGWDPTDPKNGNTRLYTLVLGSQVLHAAGYGMGLVFDGRTGTGDVDRDEAVITYYGDGASSQGDVHEAMVFAASYQAPTVFFLQNNQWAISVPVSTQSRVPLVQRSAGYGIPSVRVDGNDVLASYAVSRTALDDARSGKGPQAIEAVTYRLGAHTTSDDPTKYRGSDEEQLWAGRDPIVRMRAFLEGRGASAELFADVEAEAADAAEDLRARSVVLTSPSADKIFDHVYSEPHPLIDEQKAWRAKYEASFEGGAQ